MRVTVFGATGGVGRQVVTQALRAGHEVVAVVRDPARLDISPLDPGHPGLTVMTVPGLADPEPLLPALDGGDAAISGVGPRSRRDSGVATRSTTGILRAMESAGVRRLAAVSAVPVGPVPEGEGWAYRRVLLPLLGALLRDVYADLTRMEEEIRRSAVEWTIVRPPRLVDKPLTGAYRMVIGGNVPRGHTISRADVAHAMLAVLDDPATVRQPVGVAA